MLYFIMDWAWEGLMFIEPKQLMDMFSSSGPGKMLQDMLLSGPMGQEKLRVVKGFADTTVGFSELFNQNLQSNKQQVRYNNSHFKELCRMFSDASEALKGHDPDSPLYKLIFATLVQELETQKTRMLETSKTQAKV